MGADQQTAGEDADYFQLGHNEKWSRKLMRSEKELNIINVNCNDHKGYLLISIEINRETTDTHFNVD